MRDRRASHRPSNGDKKICPKCRSNTAEFRRMASMHLKPAFRKKTG